MDALSDLREIDSAIEAVIRQARDEGREEGIDIGYAQAVADIRGRISKLVNNTITTSQTPDLNGDLIGLVGLDQRVLKLLARHDITTIHTLYYYHDRLKDSFGILGIHGFGKKSFELLNAALNENGLEELKLPVGWPPKK